MSHTGAPAGSDEVFEAAFRRAGVLRVNTLEELFGWLRSWGSSHARSGRASLLSPTEGGLAL